MAAAEASSTQPALRDLGRFVAVAVQLGLVLWIIRLYRIEELSGFADIAPWIFGAFLIHAWLPQALRMPCFLVLSLTSIGLIFGAAQGAGLVAMGLVLIGICHLPVPLLVRVVLLVAAGGTLAAIRAERLATPAWPELPTVVLPILGAMFMFRLAVYLYDLRNEKGEVSIWQRLSYFFMVPNVCFPLFPVVDYQTFKRTYYDGEPYPIYQKGVLWILRGILQLLVYRAIYYHVVPAPIDVFDLWDAVLFVVATYALYLRISGQFHLIIGVLSLFGFNLPETHRLYFLASSFTDYWRRINIYWKDFMTKMVFYPVFMRLRKRGMLPGLAASTVIVFLGTWVLHSYQWFWIRGKFPLRAADGVFWGSLGVLVLFNTLYDARKGKKAKLGDRAWRFPAALGLSARTVGMFVAISTLWSLWSSESPGHWWSTVRQAANSPTSDWLLLLAVLLGLVLVGALLQIPATRGIRFSIDDKSFRGSVLSTTVTAVLVALIGLPAVQARLGADTSNLVASLQSEKLNRQDEELLQRGYYEGLLDEGTLTSGLWQTEMQRPADWKSVYNSDAVRDAEGILEYELIPSVSLEVKRAPFSTNRWGMRDIDYTKEKPAGTYRIALLGSSQIMGGGVPNDQTFDPVLEELLNRKQAGRRYDRYEILNFSVGGYSVIQNRRVSEEKMPPFDPDAVFFIVHSTEKKRLTMNLYRAIRGGDHDFDYPFILERVEQAGVRDKVLRADIERGMEPYYDEIIPWCLEGIAESARRLGAVPVLVFAPTLKDDEEALAYGEELIRLGQAAGFVTLDLSDTYRGVAEPKSLSIAAWDFHPNAEGHSRLAATMYRQLMRHPELIGL